MSGARLGAAVLGAALLAGAPRAQGTAEAARMADSLLSAAVEASRAALAGHTSLAASGPAGTLYYRIDAAGDAECRAEIAAPALAGFGDALCFSVATVGAGAADDDGGPWAPDSVWVGRAVVDGAAAHVVGFTIDGDPDGMEAAEVWLDAESLALRRLRARGEMQPGLRLGVEVHYDGRLPEAAVPFPRRLRLRIENVREMMEAEMGDVVASGVTLRDVLAFAEAAQKANPTPDGAVGVRLLKAAVADVPFEVVFPVAAVRLDVPLPGGLFGGDAPGGSE